MSWRMKVGGRKLDVGSRSLNIERGGQGFKMLAAQRKVVRKGKQQEYNEIRSGERHP